MRRENLGRNFAYEIERKRANVSKRKLAKNEARMLLESDEPTESIIYILKQELERLEKKGLLGTDRALTPLVEGAMRATASRGDWNNVLRSDLLKRCGYGTQKASTGADVRMFKQLFGDGPEAIQVLNSLAELSKAEYTHLAYATYYDEDNGELKYSIDRKEYLDSMEEQRTKMNKKRRKAGQEEISKDDFYNLVIDNLGEVGADIRQNDELKKENIAEGIAEVIEFYNKDRGDAIMAELAKKDPKDKWKVNPGVFAAEIGGGYWELNPKTGKREYIAKYYGETASSRAYIESATTADAERIDSWASPRMRQAILDNRKMVTNILERIETEKREEAKKARISGNEEEAERLEDYANKKRVIWNRIYKKLEISQRKDSDTDTGLIDREGKAQFVAEDAGTTVTKEEIEGI